MTSREPQRLGYRHITMGPHLHARLRPAATAVATMVLAVSMTVAMALSLATCGGPGSGPGEAPAPVPGETTSGGAEGPGSAAPGPVEHDLLAVVSTTLGGGAVDERAVDLTEPGGVAELVEGLEPVLATRVRNVVRRQLRRPAVQEALDGGAGLHGAVVWVGCETPREVVVRREGGDLLVRAVVKPKGAVQCLAPVTSVAVFTA